MAGASSVRAFRSNSSPSLSSSLHLTSPDPAATQSYNWDSRPNLTPSEEPTANMLKGLMHRPGVLGAAPCPPSIRTTRPVAMPLVPVLGTGSPDVSLPKCSSKPVPLAIDRVLTAESAIPGRLCCESPLLRAMQRIP